MKILIEKRLWITCNFCSTDKGDTKPEVFFIKHPRTIYEKTKVCKKCAKLLIEQLQELTK